MSGEARNLKDVANEHPEMNGHMPHEQGPLRRQKGIRFTPKGAGVQARSVITYARRVRNSVTQNKGKRPKLTDCNPIPYQEVPEMIRIPGDDEILKPVGHNCCVCKRDLMDRTFGYPHSNAPPSTVILACGHTFHTYCFMSIPQEGQEEDPSCYLCSRK